ncbi:hypothetical protein K438DRAFT_106298 [Mycena galopus ATCC 62051]|nr:hypothetical protein K438DRAFT_106298 [Mycena galopus ATCC 62051]
MEIQQHVRKLWEAAAMWGYRDGYADGYDDGTEDRQRFAASARQPYEYEATVPTSTWTSPHPTSSYPKSPMFARPQPIPFEEKDAAPWDTHDQRFSCRRITPNSLSGASASGMSHPVVFRASAPSIRSSHRSSPYPRRSMSPSPLSLCPSPAERFACEACGKDFSRLHDRKRHYETQHGGKPVTHRCMYCEKDFTPIL